MRLETKLADWRKAGLIDEATAHKIAAHEAAQRKPIALYALGALGGGTIALGIVSVIAANWDEISGRVKLGCDLLLGIGLAVGTFFAATRKASWATEVLVTLLYGYTLASLALVGQVYQLDTPEWQAFCLWSAATLPLCLLGQSRYLAVLVLAGLFTTHGVGFEALFDYLDYSAGIDSLLEQDILATLCVASPLAYALLARVPWLVRNRPEYSATTTAVAWLGIAAGGFAAQFIWYDSLSKPELRISLLTTLALLGGFAWALPRLYPGLPPRAQPGIAAAFALVWLSLVAGTSFARDSLEFVGALLQIGWFALLSWVCLQLGLLRAFNLLTAVIALRILVVYFEVFHSLLNTGLGLIIGGLLTLAMAYVWRRKTRDLAQRVGPSSGSTTDVA